MKQLTPFISPLVYTWPHSPTWNYLWVPIEKPRVQHSNFLVRMSKECVSTNMARENHMLTHAPLFPIFIGPINFFYIYINIYH